MFWLASFFFLILFYQNKPIVDFGGNFTLSFHPPPPPPPPPPLLLISSSSSSFPPLLLLLLFTYTYHRHHYVFKIHKRSVPLLSLIPSLFFKGESCLARYDETKTFSSFYVLFHPTSSNCYSKRPHLNKIHALCESVYQVFKGNIPLNPSEKKNLENTKSI